MLVLRYQRDDGSVPMSDWLATLVDKQARARVLVRLKRLEAGIFGDCKPVGEGVLELREHAGAGHRMSFGRRGAEVVILPCGGDRQTQATDIKNAKACWADWKRRQP